MSPPAPSTPPAGGGNVKGSEGSGNMKLSRYGYDRYVLSLTNQSTTIELAWK